MTYRIRTIRDESAFLALEEAWTDLLLQVPTATVFASFQWNAAWWNHFGQGAALRVLTASDATDRLVGIAPLMVQSLGPFGKLMFIGTGLSDLGDLIIRPDHAAGVVGAIFAYLQAHRGAWDLGDLSEVPPESPVLSHLQAHRPAGLRLTVRPQTPCPAIALPASWEAYVQALPRKRRYYVSSFPRKFLREHNGRLALVTAPQDVEAAVATFYRLHLARWQVKAGEISEEHRDPHFRPFLEEACARLAARGWLRLVHLQAGEQTVASSINFFLHGRWNSYMKGYDPAWSQARPGTVLDALRIQQAISEHAHLLDFGRGDEAYKSGFGVTNYQTTRLLLGNLTPRSRAAFALMALRDRLRERRNPAAAPALQNADPAESLDTAP